MFNIDEYYNKLRAEQEKGKKMIWTMDELKAQWSFIHWCWGYRKEWTDTYPHNVVEGAD